MSVVSCEADTDPFFYAPGPDPTDTDTVVGEFRQLRGYARDAAFMGVEREIRRLLAVQAAMVHEVSVSYSYLDDAHHSPTSWVQAITNSSKGAALHHTHVARLFAELPLLAAAAAAGQVGPDQVRLLVGLHTNPRCGHLLAGSEALLLEDAKTLKLHEFRQICQRWLAHADPDGAHREHQLSREHRSVRSINHGAGHELHAQGDALTGDTLREIIDQHAAAELDNDLAWRSATYGDQAAQHPLPRTAQQRRYDAFVAVMLKGAGRDGHGNTDAVINIFTNEPTLRYAIRNYFGDNTCNGLGDEFGDPGQSERLWMCQTASGAPVDPHDLIIAALLGQVRRVVTDASGRVVDLGRKQRLFTGAAREAVLLSGDRCCWPGCEQRGPFIQIDHLTPWTGPSRDHHNGRARSGGGGGGGGGETNALNGAPMCAIHNRKKHTGRFTVTRDHTGWHHYRPDGSEIAPRT
ncbi:MAG: DUF222 domain-containing protein [Actinobacteria bacterium]|nr:DUF222 domain-containing protein [Actinomycetota bacterium]